MKKLLFFLLLLTSCKPTVEGDSVNINDKIYLIKGDENLLIIKDELNEEELQDAKTEIYCDHVDRIYGSSYNPTQIHLNQLKFLNECLEKSKEMRDYYREQDINRIWDEDKITWE